MDDMINNGMDIPKWITTGKTILFQKDRGKGKVVDNYWSISNFPLMLKLMTGIIANNVCEYLEMFNLLPLEQNGCRRNSRGKKDQLLIEKWCWMIVRRDKLMWDWYGLITRKFMI